MTKRLRSGTIVPDERPVKLAKRMTKRKAVAEPILKLAEFASKVSRWAASLFFTIRPNIDSAPECAGSKSSEKKSAAKGDVIDPQPVEVDYKTLRDTLKAAPEHFETMVFQTLDLVHNLWHDSHILHGNITPDTVMCEMIDESPQFFFVDLDPAPGIIGTDPRDGV